MDEIYNPPKTYSIRFYDSQANCVYFFLLFCRNHADKEIVGGRLAAVRTLVPSSSTNGVPGKSSSLLFCSLSLSPFPINLFPRAIFCFSHSSSSPLARTVHCSLMLGGFLQRGAQLLYMYRWARPSPEFSLRNREKKRGAVQISCSENNAEWGKVACPADNNYCDLFN